MKQTLVNNVSVLVLVNYDFFYQATMTCLINSTFATINIKEFMNTRCMNKLALIKERRKNS